MEMEDYGLHIEPSEARDLHHVLDIIHTMHKVAGNGVVGEPDEQDRENAGLIARGISPYAAIEGRRFGISPEDFTPLYFLGVLAIHNVVYITRSLEELQQSDGTFAYAKQEAEAALETIVNINAEIGLYA
jgi:hypothetical protein